MARLSQVQRERAVGMLLAGRSIAEVGRTFACTRPTIYMLQRRLRQTGTTSDRPRSGRPKVTMPREDRLIRLAHLRNRFLPATVTATTIPRRPVSPRTVRRRLRQFGLRARRPHVGIILTRRHRQERRCWVRVHFNWRRVRWNTVIFSDESRFRLMNADGRIRVYRRRGERYADAWWFGAESAAGRRHASWLSMIILQPRGTETEFSLGKLYPSSTKMVLDLHSSRTMRDRTPPGLPKFICDANM